MLWSDPVDKADGAQDGDFVSNAQRGCSFVYGATALNKFLQRNSLLSLIRGHEVQLEGFKMHNWKNKNFPQVITIFSAANYCDSYNNKGAVIKFENNSLNIQQFHYTPHPYYLPNFMNIFAWSMPFVAEKVTEMFSQVLKQTEDADEEDDETVETAPDADLNGPPRQKVALKNKIQFVSKMLKMQKVLREENEHILKIKALNNNKLPQGILLEGKEAMETFAVVKVEDMKNEMRPDTI